MSHQSLEDLIRRANSPVDLLRQSQIGPYAFPVVRSEFTNWRDEQRAWRESCALFDQSHHMTDLYVEGPDALRMLTHLGVNSFANFRVDRAKQFVACNPEGYVIGDVILFPLDEQRFSLVGRPPASNWVQFHAETGGYRVTVERDERSAINQGRRKMFRFQVQGPNAIRLMESITNGPAPDLPFFGMHRFPIAGHEVRALRHGMVGQPGWELFGPWEHAEEVRSAIVEAGRAFGLRQVGSRAYPTSCLESGWIPSPLPAVYTSPELKPYREWLSAKSYEANASLGGSLDVDDITAYYLTPWDLGYGSIVKFDHDFIGRRALEAMASRPHRSKVTLIWNAEDVGRAFALFCRADGNAPKYIDLPLANYATLPYDVVSSRGRTVGISTYTGYIYNERAMVSLAIVDADVAVPGKEVTVVWGEPGGGSSKPTVERHAQTEVRATVAPAPLSQVARESYRPASRT